MGYVVNVTEDKVEVSYEKSEPTIDEIANAIWFICQDESETCQLLVALNTEHWEKQWVLQFEKFFSEAAQRYK